MKYLEDFVPGEIEVAGDYVLPLGEMIDYSKIWDPLPFHIDPDSDESKRLGGVIAAGTQLVAITVRTLVNHPPKVAIIVGLGWDEVRFHQPARPGDTLTVTRQCLEARPSKSMSDRGVVRNRITLTNQNGELVLSYIDAILVTKNPGDHHATIN